MVRPITTTFLCADQAPRALNETSDAAFVRAPSAVIIDFENARRRVAVG